MKSSVPPPPYSESDGREAPYNKHVHQGGPTVSAAPAAPQQNVIVVTDVAPPNVVYNPYPVAMTTAFVLSCVVFWCFGWLFGAIAFILAVMGSDSSTRGDVIGALRLRNASYGVSIAGIVVGIVVITVVVVVNQTHAYD